MVFCNVDYSAFEGDLKTVTILILIDGFLQYNLNYLYKRVDKSHNPYFNRWFSAM